MPLLRKYLFIQFNSRTMYTDCYSDTLLSIVFHHDFVFSSLLHTIYGFDNRVLVKRSIFFLFSCVVLKSSNLFSPEIKNYFQSLFSFRITRLKLFRRRIGSRVENIGGLGSEDTMKYIEQFNQQQRYRWPAHHSLAPRRQASLNFPYYQFLRC